MTEEEIRAAASLPDDPVVDGAVAGPDSPDGGGALFSGVCHGGPWNGQRAEVRCPKGFLLVHRPVGQCWVYDRRDDGDFYVRSDLPGALRDSGPVNRFRAAEEPNYDIRVVEW